MPHPSETTRPHWFAPGFVGLAEPFTAGFEAALGAAFGAGFAADFFAAGAFAAGLEGLDFAAALPDLAGLGVDLRDVEAFFATSSLL